MSSRPRESADVNQRNTRTKLPHSDQRRRKRHKLTSYPHPHIKGRVPTEKYQEEISASLKLETDNRVLALLFGKVPLSFTDTESPYWFGALSVVWMCTVPNTLVPDDCSKSNQEKSLPRSLPHDMSV